MTHRADRAADILTEWLEAGLFEPRVEEFLSAMEADEGFDLKRLLAGNSWIARQRLHDVADGVRSVAQGMALLLRALPRDAYSSGNIILLDDRDKKSRAPYLHHPEAKTVGVVYPWMYSAVVPPPEPLLPYYGSGPRPLAAILLTAYPAEKACAWLGLATTGPQRASADSSMYEVTEFNVQGISEVHTVRNFLPHDPPASDIFWSADGAMYAHLNTVTGDLPWFTQWTANEAGTNGLRPSGPTDQFIDVLAALGAYLEQVAGWLVGAEGTRQG